MEVKPGRIEFLSCWALTCKTGPLAESSQPAEAVLLSSSGGIQDCIPLQIYRKQEKAW